MAGPLRVAVLARAVLPIHGVGGLERSVHDLVRHLAARDVQVTLVTPPPSVGADASSLSSPNITLRPVPYLTFPLANRRGTTILDRSTAYPVFGMRAGRLVLGLARSGAIDVVHGFGASVLGYALGRRQAPAPLVFNPQGLEEFGATGSSQPWMKRVGYGPLRRAVRISAHAADAIIATDDALVPALTRHLHPRPGQVHVIPNGIDLAWVDALATAADGQRIRARHGLAPDDTVLVSVGRLEFNKGFDLLPEALARASQAGGPLAGRPWRWVVIGAGPFAREIEAAVAAHGLAPHVLFAGRASDADLHAWYEAATLFVHPTRYEGSSIVTLEAMAHRRAVVATRAGGLPDKVRPGVNGWLVAPGDPAALAAALADALPDRARLETMGHQSRGIVEREFAWPVLADRHLALYASLLNRR
ncbi:MAG: glycosyltransferase family 4 protein [Vicinamibacterales bacterium]